MLPGGEGGEGREREEDDSANYQALPANPVLRQIVAPGIRELFALRGLMRERKGRKGIVMGLNEGARAVGDSPGEGDFPIAKTASVRVLLGSIRSK